MSDTVKPVLEGVLEKGPPARLLGGYCPRCERKFFPEPFVCPVCQGAVERVPLSDKGILYSFALVRTKAPFGLPQPYAVGYVDLQADGLRIISLLDPERLEDLAIGVPMGLRVAPLGLGADHEPCLRYYFTPEESKENA